jgi:hypothetical protein
MYKRIILGLGSAALIASAVMFVGCGDNGTTNNNFPDMAMKMNQGDMANGGGGNPDMSFVCFSGTPMTDTDFLNACSTAAHEDVMPFYPTLAPNGVLPSLP